MQTKRRKLNGNCKAFFVVNFQEKWIHKRVSFLFTFTRIRLLASGAFRWHWCKTSCLLNLLAFYVDEFSKKSGFSIFILLLMNFWVENVLGSERRFVNSPLVSDSSSNPAVIFLKKNLSPRKIWKKKLTVGETKFQIWNIFCNFSQIGTKISDNLEWFGLKT